MPSVDRVDAFLDRWQRRLVAFGCWFLAVCFFAGGFFYADGHLVSAAAYWVIGILFAPPFGRAMVRRWPRLAEARAREVAIAVLICYASLFLG
ncbi:MAG: hypothetical protein KC466_12505 [Myxococcales bacterium]|nr:hypothetical protein [Myxococcales bacterium]